MKPTELPIISTVLEFGADDAIFNGLLLSGPVLLGVIVLLDRSVITAGLAAVYIAILVLYVLYQGATSEPGEIPN